ncbi:MAG: NAD-dependent epimerase/dehydratase family protein [Candidatus Nanopelagicales bacterium]
MISAEVPGGAILVLGGTGFLGSAICGRFAAAGWRTCVLSRDPARPGSLPPQVRVVIGDAGRAQDHEDLLPPGAHVVYAVGALNPQESNADPTGAVRQSLQPLVGFLEYLRGRRDINFTFISSGGTVYGEPRHLPVGVDHPTDPITAYGILKLTAEKYVGMYRRLYGVNGRTVRVANAYGPGQPVGRGQGVIGALIHAAMTGVPGVIFGDGSSVRDYIHVRDIAEALYGLAQLPSEQVPEVVNVGSGIGHSVKAVHELLCEVAGRELPVEYRTWRGFDVSALVLDTTPLRELTGLTPRDLRSGIADCWESAQATYAGSALLAASAVGHLKATD